MITLQEADKAIISLLDQFNLQQQRSECLVEFGTDGYNYCARVTHRTAESFEKDRSEVPLPILPNEFKEAIYYRLDLESGKFQPENADSIRPAHPLGVAQEAQLTGQNKDKPNELRGSYKYVETIKFGDDSATVAAFKSMLSESIKTSAASTNAQTTIPELVQ